MKATLFIIALFGLSLVTSCAGDGKKDKIVVIKTTYGDMVVVLYDETPKHKENFLKLASEKYYDSTLFHRVIDGFMIQGGDPDSKKAQPGQPLGMGGPGYTIPAEFNPKLYHEKGALAAARLGDGQNPGKESSGSQFYIVHGTVISEAEMKIDQQKMQTALGQMYQSGQHQALFDSLGNLYRSGDMKGYQEMVVAIVPRVEKATGTSVSQNVDPAKVKAYTTVGGVPFLDDQYTVFGKVISGLDVIDKIAAVAKDQGDRPVENIAIKMEVKEMSRKKIEKEYGYVFPEIPKTETKK